MNNLKILRSPNEKLKKIAEEVKEFNDSLRKIIAEMITIMKKEKGIGLAGNQVGLLKRIIVIDTLKSDKPNGFFGALINPVILDESDKKNISAEGCLSFPNKKHLIQRPESIVVKFQNSLGEKQEKKFKGITAICIQHEIDHLNGITFDTKSFGELNEK